MKATHVIWVTDIYNHKVLPLPVCKAEGGYVSLDGEDTYPTRINAEGQEEFENSILFHFTEESARASLESRLRPRNVFPTLTA
jgi:hypothetical protein